MIPHIDFISTHQYKFYAHVSQSYSTEGVMKYNQLSTDNAITKETKNTISVYIPAAGSIVMGTVNFQFP